MATPTTGISLSLERFIDVGLYLDCFLNGTKQILSTHEFSYIGDGPVTGDIMSTHTTKAQSNYMHCWDGLEAPSTHDLYISCVCRCTLLGLFPWTLIADMITSLASQRKDVN